VGEGREMYRGEEGKASLTVDKGKKFVAQGRRGRGREPEGRGGKKEIRRKGGKRLTH